MVNVRVDFSGVYKKLSGQAVQRGKYALANQALSDMNQFVPMKEGILRMTASLAIDGGSVIWRTPYARAQFYGFVGKGYRVYNYTTPNTSRRWDLRGKARYMADWERAFMKGAEW